MTRLFEERERAAELIFAHAEEVRFLSHRRGITSLAQWASERMGADAAATEAYAQALVAAMVEGATDEALIEQVRGDLEARGIAEPTERLRALLAQFVASAILKMRAD